MCWDDLADLLSDLEFQQTRLGALPGSEPAAVTIYDVLREFSNALEAMPAELPGRAAVEVLSRVLDHCAHLLHEHPQWLVQQLTNACDLDQTALADRAGEAEKRCPWPRLRVCKRPAISTIL